MVLDIQTVQHILKNTTVQNAVNKPFVYITDLTSTLSISADLNSYPVRFLIILISALKSILELMPVSFKKFKQN